MPGVIKTQSSHHRRNKPGIGPAASAGRPSAPRDPGIGCTLWRCIGNSLWRFLSTLVGVCRMVGDQTEEVCREIRLLENEDPGKSFIIFAHSNEVVNRINQWKIDNSRRAITLEAKPMSPGLPSCGFKLRCKKMEAIKVVIGMKMMITFNLKKENLANGPKKYVEMYFQTCSNWKSDWIVKKSSQIVSILSLLRDVRPKQNLEF
uniref:RING-type E3 ubiquitin transferase n=1 Tax=Caenorhabditis tropicalis TaxID=1561998 RepID=A0A1I7UQW8_9PELO